MLRDDPINTRAHVCKNKRTLATRRRRSLRVRGDVDQMYRRTWNDGARGVVYGAIHFGIRGLR